MQIRLRQFRDRLGLTLDEMSERSGFSTSQLSRWEAGKSNIPSERLPTLAQHYECSVSEIFAEDGDVFVSLGPQITVAGPVQAGRWLQVWEVDADDRQTFTGRPDVTVPLSQRFGVVVKGDSMNDLYPHGTYLECVSFLGGAEIENGKRVIVERLNVAGDREVTVKEYLRDDDGIEWLIPRSSNPAFQTPIRTDEQPDDIVEVQIKGIVVGSYRKE